jgi:predicted phage-related endonuclease
MPLVRLHGVRPQAAAMTSGIELDTDAQGYLTALRQLNAQIGELTEARDMIRSYLEKILGDEPAGLVGGEPVVTWRWDTPSTVTDTARLKSEWPDVWAACQKPRKPSRPFKLIQPKDSP